MAKKPTKKAATESAQKSAVNISGNALFYKSPQPLAREQHQNYGVNVIEKPFAFMQEQHFLPITAAEFAGASSSSPIIFAGEDKTPLFVMGIRSNENLFVDDGKYNQDFYLPAFARRYPFVLASDPNSDRLIVCVDEEAECVSKSKSQHPFFDGEEATKYTNDAFEFLQNFERDRLATKAMVDRFTELDLFESKEMNFQGRMADGSLAQKQKIADYFAVTEERLRKLDDKTVSELNKNGYLAAAHAHMISLVNWQRLVNMTLRKQMAEQSA